MQSLDKTSFNNQDKQGKRFVIIDGNAILHRAYHAMPGFTTSEGKPVGAIYGFVSMLLRLVTDLKPTYLAVAFDRPKPTFRQELFVGYQQGRPAMADDLVPQIKGVHDVVVAMNIPIFEVDGYEADDVIGTLAFQAVQKGGKDIEVVIVSGDRDLLQLVNSHVKVYMPIKGLTEAKMYDGQTVLEKYGIDHSQIIDMKALTGDASDKYPGVPGIGPKTASLLLHKYQTLKNLYEHLADLPERQAKALAEGIEAAGLAKKLATIVCDVPINLRLEECRFKIVDKEKVVAVLQSFGFKTLTNRFLELIGEKPIEINKSSKFKKSIDNSDQLRLV